MEFSAGEAGWRTLGYHITQKKPGVSALPIHVPDDLTHRQYATRRGLPAATSSLLDHYFVRPLGFFTFGGVIRAFEDLLYTEYWSLFRTERYNPSRAGRANYFVESAPIQGQAVMHVILRQESNTHVCRLHSARVSEGERFYLRRLLQHRPARSYRNLKEVRGIVAGSFQEAAISCGLFDNEVEVEYAITEAVQALYTPRQIRLLFTDLLVNDCVPSLLSIWNKFREKMALDLRLQPFTIHVRKSRTYI